MKNIGTRKPGGPVTGGRARAVHTRGNTYDNGQHLLVGAYRELLGLMRRVGVAEDALLRIPLEIRYTRGFALRELPLPGPLGLLAGPTVIAIDSYQANCALNCHWPASIHNTNLMQP